ncbi:MAG: universal stress protein [Thermodesulfobacteriota bacterium]|nr:universal stress protein [Thermodesulfobacteriota bacterium]
MDDIKKILVPLAFTEYSDGVFKCAANMAEKHGSKILVLSIINARDVSSVERVVAMGYEVDGEHYVEQVIEKRKQDMNKIADNNGFDREKIKILFKVGHPVDEILKTIVKEKPDLVVMGTRGRSSLRNTLIGDVASKVFKRSPVNVLSFRGEKCRARLLKRVKFE